MVYKPASPKTPLLFPGTGTELIVHLVVPLFRKASFPVISLETGTELIPINGNGIKSPAESAVKSGRSAANRFPALRFCSATLPNRKNDRKYRELR
jgi:hypothetical protein